MTGSTILARAVPARQPSPKSRQITAWHEAGHAVAAWRFGWTIERVSIVPDIGETGLARSGHIEVKSVSSGPIPLMIFALAGAAAQRRFAPRSRVPAFSGSDLALADRQAQIHSLSVRSEQALKRFAAEEAGALIDVQWHLVSSLAAALLEKDVMTHDDVGDVVLQAERQRAVLWTGEVPPAHQLAKLKADRVAVARGVSRRDVEAAVADAALRYSVMRKPLDLSNPATCAEIVERMAFRGIDPDLASGKLTRLIEKGTAAMAWRKVSS